METTDHSVQFVGGTLGRQRHPSAFFDSLDEEHRVLRSFIKDGCDPGEKAFHIVGPEPQAEHLKRLAEAEVNVERAVETGKPEVWLYQNVYFRGEGFDQDVVLALVHRTRRGGEAV